MPRLLSPLSPHARLLLRCLDDAQHCLSLSESDWDVLLRAARSARLLGVLAARVTALASPFTALPAVAQRHLLAGENEARFRRQKTLFLLDTVARQLYALNAPQILLKGSAYVVQQLPIAAGRLPSDVDLMVPGAALDHAERLLLDAGWQFQKTDAYDQRYYRAWTHELPPLQLAGQALELDLHHTILPPIGRLNPDTGALFAAALPVPGTHYKVLCPADQVLHAAAHLIQDSDCTGRLRDLVDIDGLLRVHAAATAGFWNTLYERATLHHLGGPLWYALIFARAWLNTPVPPDAMARFETFRPSWLGRSATCALIGRALPPANPDGQSTTIDRLTSGLLMLRALWLRMPPLLLAYHGANKAWRALRPLRGREAT